MVKMKLSRVVTSGIIKGLPDLLHSCHESSRFVRLVNKEYPDLSRWFTEGCRSVMWFTKGCKLVQVVANMLQTCQRIAKGLPMGYRSGLQVCKLACKLCPLQA